jgi:hypothetical protein
VTEWCSDVYNDSSDNHFDWLLLLGEKAVMNTFVNQRQFNCFRLLLLTGYENAEPGNIRQPPDSLFEDDIRYFVFQPQER